MLDIHFIREHAKEVQKAAKHKNVEVDIEAVLKLDARRRELQAKTDALLHERNEVSKAKNIERGKEIKKELAALEGESKGVEAELTEQLLRIPNMPTDDTPVGKDEAHNKILGEVGERPKFAFEPKDHVALGEALGLIDNAKGSEVSGARFTYLKGGLVLLQNALAQYAFSILTNRGRLEDIIAGAGLDLPATPFTPIIPPLMIKPDVFRRMGRLEPKEERYHIPSDDLYLIGSAEHTLGPIHMGASLKEADLPLRYFAYTPAFRREAGSYGKDTRGIIRLHQFDKIEMESFTTPELSRREHEFFIAVQEHIVGSLGIPYRKVLSCTGDLGDPNARKVDIECWMPGQGKYRETHSADYMTDFQARRLGTRVKLASGETRVAHMNDATCIAMGRMLAVIMENFQEADGRVRIPEILLPYMNGETHLS